MSTFSQRNFSGGELSPELHARVDLVKYATGAKTLRNTIVKRSGGSESRPGSLFVAEVKDSTKRVRLVKFNVGNTDIVLEFGHLYVRWYGLSGPGQALQSPKVITNVTQALPAVVTSAAHGYSNGDEVYISGVVGMTELNGRNFKVAGVAVNSFELRLMDGVTGLNSTAFTAYSSAGSASKVKEVVTTISESILPELKFSQESGSALIVVHNSMAPIQINYLIGNNISITTLSFAPTLSAPVLTAPALAAGAGIVDYVVTAVDSLTGEESLVSNIRAAAAPAPSSATPKLVDWAAITGAGYYKIYRRYTTIFGGFGLIARTTASAYNDIGLIALGTEDRASRPPENRNPFGSIANFPSVVAFAQQRLLLAATINESKTVWASRIGVSSNFLLGNPISADDSVKFRIKGDGNKINNMLDADRILLLTDAAEYIANGNDSGALTAVENGINLRKNSTYGSDPLFPIQIDNIIFFLQFKSFNQTGNLIRSIGFSFDTESYKGNDVTAFSRHLFRKHEIKDWESQKLENSIIWAVREDGIMVALTFIPEHQIWGWHRHDTDGEYENVCVADILESVEAQSVDNLWTVVNRTIGGVQKRYIERSTAREFTDIRDLVCMDSALSYDGRNGLLTTMVLSGKTLTITGITNANPAVLTYTGPDPTNGDTFSISGVIGMTQVNGNTYTVTNVNTGANTLELFGVDSSAYGVYTSGGTAVQGWSSDDSLTLTASVAFFTAADIGNEIQLYILNADGGISEQIRCEITAFTSTTIVTVRSNRTVPASLQTTATTAWAKAVDVIGGLWHLEGKTVAIFADGYVVGSPNNDSYVEYVVANGQVTLTRPYAVIHAGLPYTCDVETLDIDTDQSETLKDKKSIVSKVTVQLFETRGVWAGGKAPTDDGLDGLNELKIRNEEGYDESVDLFTGQTEIIIEPNWESNGRVFIRQVDPVPMSVNAIMPAGLFPLRR